MHASHDKLPLHKHIEHVISLSFIQNAQPQTCTNSEVTFCLVRKKETTSETTVYRVSGRWQSRATICFPICSRLQCCSPCRLRPASSISLSCVCLSLCCDRWDISCFLNWETWFSDAFDSNICTLYDANTALVRAPGFIMSLTWSFDSHEGNWHP